MRPQRAKEKKTTTTAEVETNRCNCDRCQLQNMQNWTYSSECMGLLTQSLNHHNSKQKMSNAVYQEFVIDLQFAFHSVAQNAVTSIVCSTKCVRIGKHWFICNICLCCSFREYPFCCELIVIKKNWILFFQIWTWINMFREQLDAIDITFSIEIECWLCPSHTIVAFVRFIWNWKIYHKLHFKDLSWMSRLSVYTIFYTKYFVAVRSHNCKSCNEDKINNSHKKELPFRQALHVSMLSHLYVRVTDLMPLIFRWNSEWCCAMNVSYH